VNKEMWHVGDSSHFQTESYKILALQS